MQGLKDIPSMNSFSQKNSTREYTSLKQKGNHKQVRYRLQETNDPIQQKGQQNPWNDDE